MAAHRIRKGLRLPLRGAPSPTIEAAPAGTRVGLLGADSIGLRPRLLVQVGDAVARGQPLFEHKPTPELKYCAPAAGRVAAVQRGPKRVFESVIVELSDAERAGDEDRIARAELASFRGAHRRDLPRAAVVELLLESGQWTGLRERPFSRVANPRQRPRSIFVTATDTHPLSPPIEPILRGREDDLALGLEALARLTDGPVFVCTDAATPIALPDDARFRLERFDGPHPAGTVGLHIHTHDPVDRDRIVWHLGVQDVLAIGTLFAQGQVDVSRVVSFAGPAVLRPRLVRTRLGADLGTLSAGALQPGEARVISGSVLSGRTAMSEATGFLGRYHQQVSALLEEREREFLGWFAPGWRKFSATATFLSRVRRRATFALGTSTRGSRRAIVPIGVYEKVLPMDFEPAFLLKAIMMRDAEWAEELGCLELDEEDLALCAFVDPGKSDFCSHLRAVLTALEQEAA